MPNCYTCHQDITFDKGIRSATGKQIPLWPDKLNAHGHDADGNPIRQPLPPQYQQQQQQQTPKQQYEQRVAAATEQLAATTTQSQGGSYLDTKRIRVMLEELTKKVDDIQNKLEYNTQIDTNKLIGQLQQVHDVIAPFLNTQGVVASDLFRDSSNKQLKIDPSSINHANKADEYIERQQNKTKFVDESKNVDLDERIPDSQDELLASRYDDDNNSNKGVINEE